MTASSISNSSSISKILVGVIVLLVLGWLKSKNYWNLGELQGYIEQEYEVVFDSKQSYYTLFEQAGIRWKKTLSS